jgi:hypothetical protein
VSVVCKRPSGQFCASCWSRARVTGRIALAARAGAVALPRDPQCGADRSAATGRARGESITTEAIAPARPARTTAIHASTPSGSCTSLLLPTLRGHILACRILASALLGQRESRGGDVLRGSSVAYPIACAGPLGMQKRSPTECTLSARWGCVTRLRRRARYNDRSHAGLARAEDGRPYEAVCAVSQQAGRTSPAEL